MRTVHPGRRRERPHKARRVSLVAASMFLATACRETGSSLLPVDQLLEGACEHSGQCPSGTRCLARSAEPPSCEADETGGVQGELAAQGKTCRVPLWRRTSRGLLQTGFGVHEMDLSVDRAAVPSVLRWNAPEGVKVVRCALFAGVPEFGAVGDRMTILNFDKIALQRQDSEPSSAFEYRIAGPDRLRSACDAPGCKGYLIERLLAGCWAYSDVELVRATDLIEVDPSEVADDAGLLGEGAGACKIGQPCFDGQRFGVCLRGQCRQHCSTPLDCEAPANSDGTAGAGGAGTSDGGALPPCSLACEPVSASMGACVPLDETEDGTPGEDHEAISDNVGSEGDEVISDSVENEGDQE